MHDTTPLRGEGGKFLHVTFDEEIVPAKHTSVDMLALDQALTRLAQIDPRQAEILELYIFAGLTIAEISRELDAPVQRDWRMARAWLRTQMSPRK